jgi:hypothetical protein
VLQTLEVNPDTRNALHLVGALDLNMRTKDTDGIWKVDTPDQDVGEGERRYRRGFSKELELSGVQVFKPEDKQHAAELFANDSAALLSATLGGSTLPDPAGADDDQSDDQGGDAGLFSCGGFLLPAGGIIGVITNQGGSSGVITDVGALSRFRS